MPSKAANRIGRRAPLSLRTTEDLREKLEKAASVSGRSLTAELEHRLERSFTDEATIQRLNDMLDKFMHENEVLRAAILRAQQGYTKPEHPTAESLLVQGMPGDPPPETVPAPTPSGPFATVDLRSLIEETVESTLRRFLGTRADDHPEHVQVLRRDDPRAIEAMEKSQQAFEEFTKRQGMKSPTPNPDEPAQDAQQAKGKGRKSPAK